jgi:hypothetical protein
MLKSSSLCLYSSNLSTFWLKIEQVWLFEEISIFSNGGHLGYRTALTDTISTMMTFLTYITGFFMNFVKFCRFWPIMQIRKKGGWNWKKYILLWNYWANLNQTLLKWSLGGPLLKLCPSAPSCIQDGRSWIQDGADGHNFKRGPPKDHFSKVWLRLAQ